MTRLPRAALTFLVPLAFGGCSGSLFADDLLGYPGLGQAISTHYELNAWERQATCPTPELQGIHRAEVVDRADGRIVARIRYAWRDPGDAYPSVFPLGCRGIDERLFTVDVSGTRPRVIAMTGAQRPPTTQPGRPAS